jgi:hypothetical protein
VEGRGAQAESAGNNLSLADCFDSAMEGGKKRAPGNHREVPPDPMERPPPHSAKGDALAPRPGNPFQGTRRRGASLGKKGGCSCMARSFTSAVSTGQYPFFALILRRKGGGGKARLFPPFACAQRLPAWSWHITPNS